MAVRTNATTLAFTEQTALDTLPGSPIWEYLEPNEINTFGATITKVARQPISNRRSARKGTTVDLDSAVQLSADLTLSQFLAFAQGFSFSTFTDVGNTGQGVFSPTAVTATGYTVAANGALTQNMLIFARGFTNPENNGLKVVGAASTGTEIKASGLVIEGSPPAGARVEVVGFRTATGDLDVDASGNLTSSVLDFTTLGLTRYQHIFIGGNAAANQFTNAANKGLARIALAPAANLLTLEKRDQAYVLEANTTQDVDIYFGPFLRDLPVNDVDFAQRYFQIEAAYQNLDDISPAYEYAINNVCNELSVNMPLADKVTVGLGLIGTDTDVPTGSRKGGTFQSPVQTEALNTTNDFARLRIQNSGETDLSTYFKELTLTINNGVAPEKVIANLGAIDMNYGFFTVTGSATLLFTQAAVVTAIRNNATVGMDFALRNGDGGVVFDIPTMTMSDGSKGFSINESVTIAIEGNAHEENAYGYSLGITHFGFLPTI